MTNAEHLFEFDKNFNKIIIGTDEAGRGPGAGGVYAAAVHFDNITEGLIKDLSILNDSKKLTPKKRESIYDVIKNNTINKIVCIEVEEIEKINILNASLKAMNLACSEVNKKIFSGSSKNTNENYNNICPPCGENVPIGTKGGYISSKSGILSNNSSPTNTLTLVDGNKLIKNYIYPQQFIIKGDSKSASIAAASILAKVTRDRYMEELHEKYPMYNWRKNAGYLTAEHLEAIRKYGTTPYHRPSFLKKFYEKNDKILQEV